MNEVIDDTCRLCGEMTKKADLNMSINDDCGGIMFKHFIEYYCRIVMGEFRFTCHVSSEINKIRMNFSAFKITVSH